MANGDNWRAATTQLLLAMRVGVTVGVATLFLAVIGTLGHAQQRVAGPDVHRQSEEYRELALLSTNILVARARDLSKTHGVSPLAILSVLESAKEVLDKVAGQLGSGDDQRSLALARQDVLTQEAATHLMRGDAAAFEASLGEAEKETSKHCLAPLDLPCAARIAESHLLRAAQAHMSQPLSLTSVRVHLRAADAVLNPILPIAQEEVARHRRPNAGIGAPGQIGVVRSANTNIVEIAAIDILIAAARSGVLQSQIILHESETAGDAKAREFRRVGLEVLGTLPNLKSLSRDDSELVAVMAAGLRVRSALLSADGKADDAMKAADAAIADLEPVRVARPSDLSVQLALAEARIARGAADIAKGDRGFPRAMQAGFKDLLELIKTNRDNQFLSNRFVQLWQLARRRLPLIASDLPAEDVAGLVTVRKAVIDASMERLRDPNSHPAAELAQLRAEVFESAQWLLGAWTGRPEADGDVTLLLDTLSEKGLEGPLPDHAEAFLDQVRTLYRVGHAHRAKRRSHEAVAAFLQIEKLLQPKMQGFRCSLGTRSEDQRRFCFFLSYAVTFLGAGETWRGASEETLDTDLNDSREMVERLHGTNMENIEFQAALASLKLRQGQRSEKRGETQKAVALFQVAAQLGSADALRQLRDWQLRNPLASGSGGNSQAFHFEQRQRDLAPVLVQVKGNSTILRGGSDIFNVYLVPQQTGADPITRELQRLESYYGVKLVDGEIARLRNIVAKAVEKAGRNRAYTSRDLRRAVSEIETSDRADRPYDSPMLDPMLKEADYSLLNGDFGKALSILDQARGAVAKAGESATPKPELEYEWGILGSKYLQLAEAARRRSSEDRGTGSVGTQMWTSVSSKAIEHSDEAFSRCFSGELDRPAARGGSATERSEREAWRKGREDRGKRLYELARRMEKVDDDLSKTTLHFYRGRQTFAERMNEAVVFVLERAIYLLKQARAEGAESAADLDWYIVRAESIRGKALRSWTTNRPRPKDVLLVARRGGDFRGEAMDAYESARAHLMSYPQTAADDFSLKELEVETLLGTARTHEVLKEYDSALRLAERAVKVADDLTEADRSRSNSRKFKAHALEALSDLLGKAAQVQFDRARDLWRAMGNRIFGEVRVGDNSKRLTENEREAQQQFRAYVEKGREHLKDAQDGYLRANGELIANLRIDADDCPRCLATLRGNVRRVVALIERRMKLDFGSGLGDAMREARLEAREFADLMVEDLKLGDSKISNLRLPQSSILASSSTPVAPQSPSPELGSRASKAKRSNVVQTVIDGADPWVPQRMAKSLGEQLAEVERLHGQTRSDRIEPLAITKYAAILAYEMVAEFAIRTSSGADLHSTFRDAAIIYESLVRQLEPVAEIIPEAGEQYAVTMSDFAFALTIMSAREPKFLREAQVNSERALNIDSNLYLRELNIRLNRAHVLLAGRQFAEARAIYFNDRNQTFRKVGDENWTWRNQLLDDLNTLQSAFVSDPSIVQEIQSIRTEFNRRFPQR